MGVCSASKPQKNVKSTPQITQETNKLTNIDPKETQKMNIQVSCEEQPININPPLSQRLRKQDSLRNVNRSYDPNMRNIDSPKILSQQTNKRNSERASVFKSQSSRVLQNNNGSFGSIKLPKHIQNQLEHVNETSSKNKRGSIKSKFGQMSQDVGAFTMQTVALTKVYTIIRKSKFEEDHISKILKVQHNQSGIYRQVRMFDKQDKETLTMIDKLRAIQFGHENIQQIYELYEDTDYIYMILEQYSGVTLEEYLNLQERIDEQTLAHIIFQIAQILNYIHSKGCCHNRLTLKSFAFVDESPSQILILTDLHHLYIREKIKTIHQQYIAPESLILEELSQKQDIYQCGIIMLCLMKCKIELQEQIYNEIKKDCENVKNIIKQDAYSVQCKYFLYQCLRHIPNARYTAVNCLQDEWLTKKKQDYALNKEYFERQFKRIEEFNEIQKGILLFAIDNQIESQDESIQNIIHELNDNNNNKITKTKLKYYLLQELIDDDVIDYIVNQFGQEEIDKNYIKLILANRSKLLTESSLRLLFQSLDIDKVQLLQLKVLQLILQQDAQNINQEFSNYCKQGKPKICQPQVQQMYGLNLNQFIEYMYQMI